MKRQHAPPVATSLLMVWRGRLYNKLGQLGVTRLTVNDCRAKHGCLHLTILTDPVDTVADQSAMKLKEAPRKVSCVTSEMKLDCTIARRCIQEVVLQACGFTQGSSQLNVQASINTAALELLRCVHMLIT